MNGAIEHYLWYFACFTQCLSMQNVAENNGSTAHLLQQLQHVHPCLVQTPPSIDWGRCRLQTDWQTGRPSPLRLCQLQTGLPIDQQGPAAPNTRLTPFCTWHLLQLCYQQCGHARVNSMRSLHDAVLLCCMFLWLPPIRLSMMIGHEAQIHKQMFLSSNFMHACESLDALSVPLIWSHTSHIPFACSRTADLSLGVLRWL